MASKYHKHKNKDVKLVHRPKSLKCKLGFHFPYNAVGWPMMRVSPKCLDCNEPLKNTDRTVADKISRLFLNILKKDHWHSMRRISDVDSEVEILECDIVGCTHKEVNLIRKSGLAGIW